MSINPTNNDLKMDFIIAAGAFQCVMSRVSNAHFFIQIHSIEKFLYDQPEKRAPVNKIRKQLLIPKYDEEAMNLLDAAKHSLQRDKSSNEIIRLRAPEKIEKKMKKYEEMFEKSIEQLPGKEREEILNSFDVMIKNIFPGREIRNNLDRIFFIQDIWRDIFGRVFDDRRGNVFIQVLHLYILYLFGERSKLEINRIMPIRQPSGTTWYMNKRLISEGLCDRIDYENLWNHGDPEARYVINEKGMAFLEEYTEKGCLNLSRLWGGADRLCEDPDEFLDGFNRIVDIGFRIIRRESSENKINITV